MKPNLVTRNVGSVLLLRQSKLDPSDAEWAETIIHLNAMLRADSLAVKALVYTDGGAPTVAQRMILQKALQKTQIRAAVVSDDLKARVTSSTVALGNRNHRSFSTAEWDAAYAHLGLTPEERRAAEAALRTMSIQIL